jgi:hypothetical protein
MPNSVSGNPLKLKEESSNQVPGTRWVRQRLRNLTELAFGKSISCDLVFGVEIEVAHCGNESLSIMCSRLTAMIQLSRWSDSQEGEHGTHSYNRKGATSNAFV